jgi:hypothetical protein
MLNDLFYGENSGLLRLVLATLSASFYAILCIWMFEIPSTLIGLFMQASRYLFVPISAMLFVFLLNARFIQDLYQLDRYYSGLRYLFAAVFRLFPLSFKVTDSGMQFTDQNLLFHIGGPGYLNVERGNVVVLERLESPSRVLGAGRHYVGRYNRIKNIINLMDREILQEKPIFATTKDGIVIEIKNLQIRCRVYTGHKEGAAKRTADNPYPYSVQAIRDLTYSISVGADGSIGLWQIAVFGSVVGVLTSFINAHLLDRVIYPRFEENDSRSEVAKKIESAEMRSKLKSMGAELLWYDLGDFQVAEDIEERRRQARFANLLGQATVIRAQGEAERIANRERGRAEGQVNLLSSIIQALEESNVSGNVDENIWNIVLARTAQIIESMTTIYETFEYSAEDKNDNKS